MEYSRSMDSPYTLTYRLSRWNATATISSVNTIANSAATRYARRATASPTFTNARSVSNRTSVRPATHSSWKKPEWAYSAYVRPWERITAAPAPVAATTWATVNVAKTRSSAIKTTSVSMPPSRPLGRVRQHRPRLRAALVGAGPADRGRGHGRRVALVGRS